MVTRRRVLIAVGLAVAGLWEPATVGGAQKARKPLAAAKVEVIPNEENPGYYSARFFLRPHFQLEGLTVSLRLVSKLPSVKSAGG